MDFETHAQQIVDDESNRDSYSADSALYGRRKARERLRPKVRQQLIDKVGLSTLEVIWFAWTIWSWVGWIVERIRKAST